MDSETHVNGSGKPAEQRLHYARSFAYLKVRAAQLGCWAVEKRNPALEKRVDEEADEVFLRGGNVRIVSVAKRRRLQPKLLFLVPLISIGISWKGWWGFFAWLLSPSQMCLWSILSSSSATDANGGRQPSLLVECRHQEAVDAVSRRCSRHKLGDSNLPIQKNVLHRVCMEDLQPPIHLLCEKT